MALDPIESRLNRLESANRRWRWTALAFAITSLALFINNQKSVIGASNEPFGTLEARKFTILNDAGQPRGTFQVGERGPSLILFDENTKARASLAVTSGGPALLLMDDKGTPRAGLDVTGDGPSFSLFSPDGAKQVWMKIEATGVLRLIKPDGQAWQYPPEKKADEQKPPMPDAPTAPASGADS